MGDSNDDQQIEVQTPPFQPQANVNPNIGFLSDVGQSLGSGGFLNPDDPFTGFLNPLVTPNNALVQAQLGLAQRDITEAFQDFRLGTVNQLEANNQLTSSVANTALADINKAFTSDIADVATNFFIADVERSLGNIGSLTELGLNTTGQATNLGLNDQSQRNTFALQNFDNQLALELANQGQSRGGIGGALTGGLGGAAGGAAVGSLFPGAGTAIGAAIGGLGGAAAGGFGSQGTGGAIFSGGAGAAGLAAGGFFSPTNLFNRTNIQGEPSTANPSGTPNIIPDEDGNQLRNFTNSLLLSRSRLGVG